MCSIMGYCSCDVTYDDFKAAFELTKSRGPDDTRVIFTGKGLLGFHRLAIMGLHPEGMQPFELDGSAVSAMVRSTVSSGSNKCFNARGTHSAASLTVRSCFPFTRSTAQLCSGCWMLNLP